MQIDENSTTHNIDNLNVNKIIINELFLLCKDAIQKGIHINDYIQLVKQHIVSKNKNENELFNYLLDNKNKQKCLVILAHFYRYEIGTEKNEIKAFELYKEAAEKGQISPVKSHHMKIVQFLFSFCNYCPIFIQYS
jgi:hypothetical protein